MWRRMASRSTSAGRTCERNSGDDIDNRGPSAPNQSASGGYLLTAQLKATASIEPLAAHPRRPAHPSMPELVSDALRPFYCQAPALRTTELRLGGTSITSA